MKRAPAGALFYRLQLGPPLGLVYLKRKPARRLARFYFELAPFLRAPFPCKPGPRAAGRDPWIIARRTIRAALVSCALAGGALAGGALVAWPVAVSCALVSCAQLRPGGALVSSSPGPWALGRGY